MLSDLPTNHHSHFTAPQSVPYLLRRSKRSRVEMVWSFLTCGLAIVCLFLVVAASPQPFTEIISPLVAPLKSLDFLRDEAVPSGHEVFGFAPYWTLHKMDDVDFSTLTTLAYFGVPINKDGSLNREDIGYKRFAGERAASVFERARRFGTKVQLTVTIMNNDDIEAFLQDQNAWRRSITETIAEVKDKKLDGVNVDIEYVGNPGENIRNNFSEYVREMTDSMHREIPSSRVTVSVYASSVREPKLYDIQALGGHADAIFMMAYDFVAVRSDHAAPTAPLYGHKSGKYSYDVSTAVEDFLTVMPAEKLILGVPYYGYNYLVYSPEVKAETRPYWTWHGRPMAQMYSYASDMPSEMSGWDEEGQVGWKAYFDNESGTWRMIFLEDVKSLSLKYDFAKSKNLAGVGIWALGFDSGKKELWALLKEKFGEKLADGRLAKQ